MYFSFCEIRRDNQFCSVEQGVKIEDCEVNMKTYENKEELKAEIKRAYDKYIAEFKDIPESLKDKRCMEVDRTLQKMHIRLGGPLGIEMGKMMNRLDFSEKHHRWFYGINWGNCISGLQIPMPIYL